MIVLDSETLDEGVMQYLGNVRLQEPVPAFDPVIPPCDVHGFIPLRVLVRINPNPNLHLNLGGP